MSERKSHHKTKHSLLSHTHLYFFFFFFFFILLLLLLSFFFFTLELMAPKNQTTDTEKAANGAPPDDRCPIEEVALVVPETDDPTLPVMTFRSWFLGIASCILLIFLNTFFTFRTQPLAISAILMQIAVLPIGRFMASTLPTKEYSVLGWRFSLNPGPFNMKEHVIITIFANCGVSYGGGDAYSIGAITIMKAYYKQSISFLCALFIVLTTQVNNHFSF